VEAIVSGWSAGRLTGAACAALFLLAGCAGPTPYQKRTGGEGYHDYEIQPGVHFLSFRGNGQTTRSTVMDYWYRRAAEICGGEDRFEVLAMDSSGEELVVQTPSLLNTYTLPAVEGRIRCREK
jgi:hypothetical protein